MNLLSYSPLSIFLIVASIQGFVLGLLLVSSKKFRIKSNIALSIALIATSFLLLHNISFLIGLQNLYPSIRYFPGEMTMLLSASLYFFIHYLVFPNHVFRKYEKLILLPAVIQLLYFGAWYVICFVNPEFIDNNLVLYEFIEYTDESLAALFCGWVLYVSYNKVSRYQDNLLNNYAAIEGKNLGWLKNIIICFFALWVIWTVTHALRIIQGEDKSMYIVWLGMAGIVYWLGYFMFLRREFFEIPTFKSDKESKSGNILSEKTEEHYERLLELMTKDKLYMDSELNMSTLAEKTELSNGYLSQIINQKTGKNFFDFVNSYRVEDVKAKLKDPDFDHYSILAIGLEAGFKSKSTFNAVFKRLTGVTPSAFKKSM